MTIDQAIRILNPETSSIALKGLKKEDKKRLTLEACKMACEIMKKEYDKNKHEYSDTELVPSAACGYTWIRN